MPSLALTARSGLERIAVPGRYGMEQGEPGLVLSLRESIALASVLARKGAANQLQARVRELFRIELPTKPKRVASGSIAFAWAGPGQWMACKEGAEHHGLERQLRNDLMGLAAVADQSDARTCIRVAGPRARDALAKGVMIDLHPRAFGPGDAAVTTVGHVGAHFWQLDLATYEFVVFRSLAVDFWRWLIDSGSEFGVSVVPSLFAQRSDASH